MSSRSLTAILLANRPELAAHLDQQAAQMRAKRRDSGKNKPRPPAPRHLATVTR
jgi:hypothetical protein